MTVTADTKEQNVRIKAGCDAVRKLQYDNPEDPAHPFQYDYEVAAKSGQTLTYELKIGYDAIASFAKLPRQVGPVHGIIIQGWNPRGWLLAGRDEGLIESTRKRLWRIAHSRAVIYTSDEDDTLRFLRYVEGRTEPIEVLGEAP